MTFRIWGAALLTTTAAIAAMGSGSVQAQNASGQVAFEEIVVTSRLREERLQDVPVAVSVFTEQTIRDAGIERPTDFIAMTPNMTISDAQDVGTVAIVVRGIGQIRNGETPVAIAVDGVLQSSPFQFNQELFDIQQIEVLKGPQGALYGRNAIGGAINITTKKPTNEFHGLAVLGYGNGDFIRGEASVSGPLVEDKLMFRAAVSHREADGWITNTFLNEKVDFFENQSASLRLDYMPTDNLTFDLRLHHGETEGGAAYFALASNANRSPGVDIDTGEEVANTITPPTSNNLGFNDRSLSDISLKIDFETEAGTLTSISAFNWVDYVVGFDGFDYSDNTHCVEFGSPLNVPYACADPGFTIGGLGGGTPVYRQPFNTTFQDYESRNFSQEVRFTSPSDQRFRYIIGAYFLKRERDLVTATQEDLGFGIIPELDFDPSTPNATRLYFAEENRDKAYALFAQANYDITAALELSFALRYDVDDREQTDPRPDALRLTSNFVPITDPRTRSEKFKDLQPKATLSYKPTEEATIYASFAEGFRSGGFNAAGTEFDGMGNPIADPIYGKETSRNYELGFKTQLLDRMLTLNGAVFYSEVKDLQAFNFNGAVNAQIVTTIDKAEIKGAELEAVARLPHGFSLFGSIGYSDAEIQEFAANPAAVGNQVPYNTKLTSHLGAQYRGDLALGVEFFARADWERRGKTYFHEGGTAIGIPVRNPLNLINARVGIETEGGWALTIWAKNLTDKKYYEEVVVPDYAFQGRPRTYGVDLTKRF